MTRHSAPTCRFSPPAYKNPAATRKPCGRSRLRTVRSSNLAKSSRRGGDALEGLCARTAHARTVDPFHEVPVEQWLREGRAGSAQALEAILRWASGALLARARHDLPPPLQAKGDPADLVQETMIQVSRGLANFRGDTRRKLLGWMLRILDNQARNIKKSFRCARRRISRELPFEASGKASQEAISPALSPLQATLRTEQVSMLHQALAKLPARERAVLRLHYEESWSFARIAEALGCSSRWVQALHKRALQRMSRDISEF